MLTITLVFHGNLQDLLPAGLAKDGAVEHSFDRRASIKDVVESLGVPHPEIERLAVNGQEVGFDYIVLDGDRVQVWPLSRPVDVFTPTVLRPIPLAALVFVVDVNVGKLAALLRMAGFDTAYQHDFIDVEIARIAEKESRILLTRDCNLLKRKSVSFGHLVRAVKPLEQLLEVVRLFQLEDKLRPFSRCMRCNQPLAPVAKEMVLHRLEPLTKRYYDTFYFCAVCDKVYWPGSHRQKMLEYLNVIKNTRNNK